MTTFDAPTPREAALAVAASRYLAAERALDVNRHVDDFMPSIERGEAREALDALLQAAASTAAAGEGALLDRETLRLTSWFRHNGHTIDGRTDGMMEEVVRAALAATSETPRETPLDVEPKRDTDYCRFYGGMPPDCQTHGGRWVHDKGYCDRASRRRRPRLEVNAYNLQEGVVGEEQRRLDIEADRAEARARASAKRRAACVHDPGTAEWCLGHDAYFDHETDRVCRWVLADRHVREGERMKPPDTRQGLVVIMEESSDAATRQLAESMVAAIDAGLAWLQPLREAVSRVEYKDWRFDVGVEPSTGAPYLQIVFEDPSQPNGATTQYCRKWLLYRTMNPSEAVRTAWAAVMQAEEHEARERFRYRGRRVMGPHFDVDKLVDFYARKDNIAATKDPVPS